ncbi:MAG: hypothetical protein PHU63_04670 [Candidatus ainarchaeum sp.]|nr:hypothetical protein [Candidatus ainarchaeum sp.]
MKIKRNLNKQAQEEIVGFSMIIVLVSVILLILLSISLKSGSESTVESYQVGSFLQSLIQETSDCSNKNVRYYSIEELMYKCYFGSFSGEEEICIDKRDTCDAFLKSVGTTLNRSWNPGIGEDFPVKGYLLNITVDGELFKQIEAGNITQTSKKGALQELRNRGREFKLEFYIYY